MQQQRLQKKWMKEMRSEYMLCILFPIQRLKGSICNILKGRQEVISHRTNFFSLSIYPWTNIRLSILRSLGSQMVRRGIDEVVLSLSLVELSLEPLVELSPVVLHSSFSGQTLVTHLPLIQIVELEAIPSAYCS
jgi:hypothetical protein